MMLEMILAECKDGCARTSHVLAKRHLSYVLGTNEPDFAFTLESLLTSAGDKCYNLSTDVVLEACKQLKDGKVLGQLTPSLFIYCTSWRS